MYHHRLINVFLVPSGHRARRPISIILVPSSRRRQQDERQAGDIAQASITFLYIHRPSFGILDIAHRSSAEIGAFHFREMPACQAFNKTMSFRGGVGGLDMIFS